MNQLYDLATAFANRLETDVAVGWLRDNGLLSLAGSANLAPRLRRRALIERDRLEVVNRRMIWHFQDLVEVLDDIPCCPLKGIYLLDNVYAPDLGTRPMVDIDVLVPSLNLDQAVDRVSASLGLKETPQSSAGRWHHRTLASDEVKVEIHERLAFKHGANSTWAALSPRPGEAHGCPVHLLSHETTLVHLATHFVRNTPYASLKWVEDLWRWLNTRDHWSIDRLWEVAASKGAVCTLIAALKALRPYLPSTAALHDELATKAGLSVRLRAGANEQLFWRHIIASPLRPGRQSSSLARNLSALLLADTPQDASEFVVVKLSEMWARSAGALGRAFSK